MANESYDGKEGLHFLVSFFNRTVPLKLFIAMLMLIALTFVTQRFWRQQRTTPTNAREGLGVNELIREVKQELRQASDEMRQNNEAALFQLKTFDLEVSFVARAVATTSGKVTYELVAVDNQLETSSERTQKLMLHMEVLPPQHEKHNIHVGTGVAGSGGTTLVGPLPPKKGKQR